MTTALIITVHNRPALTYQTFASLAKSDLDGIDLIVVIDDYSDAETQRVVDEFSIYNNPILKIRFTEEKHGVKKALLEGIEEAIRYGCTEFIILDNDVKVKPNWFQKLIELRRLFPEEILSAFHSTTKNLDGSDRHKIINSGAGFAEKESIGGINMMFDLEAYTWWIKPALEKEGNWDHNACLNSRRYGRYAITTIPSYIQHTGISNSSMGHTEQPDTADGYYELELPEVALIGVCDNGYRDLERAASISQLEIKFGHINMIQDQQLGSKEAYSRFIIRELYKYIPDTCSHVLIIQPDGYVVNPEAWKDEWLQHDYIGATWCFKDGKNVGNGGFSLRSRRLMEICSKLIQDRFHPEDEVICRCYREYLERQFGFKFATEEVANRFSIEAHGVQAFEGANKYSGQFGFHGWNVDFSNWHGHIPKKPNRRWI